jgi:hypothetical protein
MTEDEKGSEKPRVELDVSRVDEDSKGNHADWISQRVSALERRLSESENYLLSFVLDPMQVLAHEGLLGDASEVSIRVKEGSFAKYAWAQALYQRDPIGVMQKAGGIGVGKKLTLKVDAQICVTIAGRRFCISFGHHF